MTSSGAFAFHTRCGIVAEVEEGRMTARLDDRAGEMRLPIPQGFPEFEPGAEIMVYTTLKGDLLGWHLPEHNIGADVSGGKPTQSPRPPSLT
jgi:hypothetical protein